jgi:hypothetical protein
VVEILSVLEEVLGFVRVIMVCLGTRRVLILFATVFGFFRNKSDFISLFLILS